MPVSIPTYNYPGYQPAGTQTTPYDPYAAQRAAAAGMGASAASASAGASANPYYNPSAAGASYGAASNTASQVQYAPDGHVLTQAEITDRAAHQGMGAAAAAASQAAGAAGSANQAAAGASYGNATNAAARPYSAPPPPPPSIQGPQAGSFNAPYNTWQNSQAYGNPYAFNLPGSMGPATWGGASDYMNPAAQNIPNGQGITGQNGTLDNIQQYMNPYLDQIIAQGTNAISHSGAAKGLFGSTGNINDIGTFATNAASQAYGDAFNRFQQDRGYQSNEAWNRYGAGVTAGDTAYNRYTNDRNNTQANNWQTYNAGTAAGADALNRAAADRGYMTGQYNTQQARDDANFWKTNAANTDMYKYGNADYQGRLGDYYSANNGINSTEQGAANASGDIYSNLATALAGLYGDKGNIGMQSAVNGGNNTTGLLDGLLSALGLMGG